MDCHLYSGGLTEKKKKKKNRWQVCASLDSRSVWFILSTRCTCLDGIDCLAMPVFGLWVKERTSNDGLALCAVSSSDIWESEYTNDSAADNVRYPCGALTLDRTVGTQESSVNRSSSISFDSPVACTVFLSSIFVVLSLASKSAWRERTFFVHVSSRHVQCQIQNCWW